MQFMKQNNLDEKLEVEANSNSLIVDAKTLRKYFNIEYKENVGDILNQFTLQLGRFIPDSMPTNLSNIEKEAVIISLSNSDSEDPNKIYCCGIRRNPIGYERTEYNSDKTKIIRPKLFSYFSNDKTISFCYSDDKSKERNDDYIMMKFAETSIT